MGPQRSSYKLTALLILVSCCWSTRWMGHAHTQIVLDEGFNRSNDRIEKRSVSQRFDPPGLTVDKCTNFYGYVCARTHKSQYPRLNGHEDEPWYDLLNTRLEALVSADITPDDSAVIRKVKQQYKLCMNYDKRDGEGSDPLKLLITKDRDFPMIIDSNSWDPLTLRILEPQKYDPSLFSIRVRDNKIYIDKYDFSAYGEFLSNLKRSSGISDPITYKSKIKQVFLRMGLINGKTEQSIDRDLGAVMNFRRRLHNIAKVELMVHTPMTVEDLQLQVPIKRTNWPQLNWESFLREVFSDTPEVEINSKTVVYVEIAYLKAVRDLMLRYDPRCIANHIKLHLLETFLSETSRSMIQISKDLASAAHGTEEPQLPRSSFNSCIYQPHMLRALNYMYLKEWFPQKSQDEALNIVRIIGNSLRDYVRITRMISNDAYDIALNQIYLTTVILGSEKKYEDYNLLQPLYTYEVPDGHFTSVLNARRYFKEYEYSELRKPKNITLTGLAILEDKPYISVEERIINLPIGYLHRMSLAPTPPENWSYATFGYRMSRFFNEMVIRKGFPSQRFSKESIGTWYGGDSHDFPNRIACIENQYLAQLSKEQSTTDAEFKKNYDEMLEQYVYDNAAFQTVYPAFKSVVRDDGIANRERLSIKDIEQYFINNWAMWHCASNKEAERNSLRVNNVLRNTNIFHLSFDCSNNTRMNPDDKCMFWG